MGKDKVIERIEFEKEWLVNLLMQDNLSGFDLECSLDAIKRIVEGMES